MVDFEYLGQGLEYLGQEVRVLGKWGWSYLGKWVTWLRSVCRWDWSVCRWDGLKEVKVPMREEMEFAGDGSFGYL